MDGWPMLAASQLPGFRQGPGLASTAACALEQILAHIIPIPVPTMAETAPGWLLPRRPAVRPTNQGHVDCTPPDTPAWCPTIRADLSPDASAPPQIRIRTFPANFERINRTPETDKRPYL